MKLILLLFFMSIQFIGASARSDSFIVKAFSGHYSVLSPIRFKKHISVIIENKSLSKIIGRLEDSEGNVLADISIYPGKFTSRSLPYKKGKIFYFVPLSPSFQKVILDFGKKAYEIPPKK